MLEQVLPLEVLTNLLIFQNKDLPNISDVIEKV